jgi:tetraacyldisaccharide 4'-kinase
MKQRWRRFAEEPLAAATFLAWLCLAPFGLLYGAGQRLRALLYRTGVFSSYRAPRPVISVGNLTVGGTGKTPIVDAIVRHLLQRGERPAVISRGYGGQIRAGVAIVSRGDGHGPLLPAADCGDEPFLLARRNPQAVVVVAPRRRAGIEAAIRDCGATLIILDDGFQHLAVQRDLDILLLDARRPFGNGSLLPAGLLREPLTAYRRAQLCILTRDEAWAASAPFPALTTLRCRHRLATELVALDGSVQTAGDLSGRRGVAFAGIAAPAAFFLALKALGLQLIDTIALNDHADFANATLETLKHAAPTADFFVTTEKDGVKLRASDLPLPCFQALLELEFAPPGKLEETIDSFLRECHESNPAAS